MKGGEKRGGRDEHERWGEERGEGANMKVRRREGEGTSMKGGEKERGEGASMKGGEKRGERREGGEERGEKRGGRREGGEERGEGRT